MLKFFRNIRRAILQTTSGKPASPIGRYFMYAVGEILLVVIGILLALQVNNWNEDHKNTQKIQQLMMAFENDIEANVKEATRVINWHYERDSIIKLILNGNVSPGEFRNNKVYREIYINFNYPFLKEEYLDKVLEQENLGKKYNHLLPQIKLYKNLIDTERQMEQTIWDQVFDEIKEQEIHLWHLLRTTEDRKAAIEYYTTNPLFLNKVHRYGNNLIGNYNRRILARRNMGIGLLKNLKRIHFKGPDEVFTSDFESLGLNPFKKIDCYANKFIIDNKANFRNSFLLVNEGAIPVSIYSLDTIGNRVDQFDLAPGEFTTSYFIGLNNHHVGMGFEVLIENKCVGKYVAVKDGYLEVSDQKMDQN